MFTPVIPGITDHEIEPILETAAEAGAKTVGYAMLRIPLEIRKIARQWLIGNVPEHVTRDPLRI